MLYYIIYKSASQGRRFESGPRSHWVCLMFRPVFLRVSSGCFTVLTSGSKTFRSGDEGNPELRLCHWAGCRLYSLLIAGRQWRFRPTLTASAFWGVWVRTCCESSPSNLKSCLLNKHTQNRTEQSSTICTFGPSRAICTFWQPERFTRHKCQRLIKHG